MPPSEVDEVIVLTDRELTEANCVPIPTVGSFFRKAAEFHGRRCGAAE